MKLIQAVAIGMLFAATSFGQEQSCDASSRQSVYTSGIGRIAEKNLELAILRVEMGDLPTPTEGANKLKDAEEFLERSQKAVFAMRKVQTEAAAIARFLKKCEAVLSDDEKTKLSRMSELQKNMNSADIQVQLILAMYYEKYTGQKTVDGLVSFQQFRDRLKADQVKLKK